MSEPILVGMNKCSNLLNFGDCIAAKFFSLLANINTVSVDYNYKIESYLTVGSHLRVATPNHIILGSGFISENDDLGKGDWCEYTNKIYNKPKKILSVRGPKTREKVLKMGIDCPSNFGDPLFVFPLVHNPILKIKFKIGLIPHYIDKNNKNFIQLLHKLNKKYNVKILDIETGVNFTKLIEDIKECEYIISSTLHGVILSIAYFRKTIWTRFSNNVIGGDFKFQDFFESLDIKYKDPMYNDNDILDKYIKVDRGNMFNLGIDILNVCPFIEKIRFQELIKLWLEYINTNEFI